MISKEILEKKFAEVFDGSPSTFRAPGRVNLIGEHTDYNDGFVMPSAIDRYTWVAIRARDDRRLRMYSTNYDELAEFDLDESNAAAKHHWSDYPRGVAVMLERAGQRLAGADILISSEVPIGAGLSSSAALEVSIGFALLSIAGIDVDLKQLALLCQRAENDFVGMRCGIMDQFTSSHGEKGKAIVLDCRTLGFELAEVPKNSVILVCNTMVKHSLASSEYNSRRADCETGVAVLAKSDPSIRALRDATIEQLDKAKDEMGEVVYRRCRHIITENERVTKAVAALDTGDAACFGELMYASHASLRNDFEVSCKELDIMVEIAAKQPGVVGARMTGGGFGGCTVNIVRAEMAENFARVVAHEYNERTGITPEIYLFNAVGGVEKVIEASA